MSAWLAGVAVLVLVLRAATARLEAGERTHLLAAVVRASRRSPAWQSPCCWRRGSRRACGGAHAAEPGGDRVRTRPAREDHVYLFDRRDGDQCDERRELTVTAELPEKRIEPIEFESTKAGPGHFVVSRAALGVAGDWTVEIAARVSDFDEFRTKVAVPLR